MKVYYPGTDISFTSFPRKICISGTWRVSTFALVLFSSFDFCDLQHFNKEIMNSIIYFIYYYNLLHIT